MHPSNPMGISREHCTLHCDESGGLWVEDLESNHGTFINGERLSPGVQRALPLGAELSIGRGEALRLRFICHASTSM